MGDIDATQGLRVLEWTTERAWYDHEVLFVWFEKIKAACGTQA
jgi:hypothetical protein